MAEGSVSVIVPAFNEAPSLAELIARIDTVLWQLACPYEILVIDDGSTDNTPEVLHDLVAQYSCLHVVRFRRNYGKAAALSEAFARAQGDFLITLDADLQDSPEEIPAFLEQLRT